MHRHLQGSVVGRWRGDRCTSYAPPLVVCVAANAAHAATTAAPAGAGAVIANA